MLEKLRALTKSKAKPDRAEAIKRENSERLIAEKIQKDLVQFSNLKTANEREPAEKYLAEMETFVSARDRSEQAAVEARVHAVEYAAQKFGTKEDNKASFQKDL